MAVRILRSPDPNQNRTTPCGPIPQGTGERRFFDDAIFGLRPTLRLERKHARAYEPGTKIDASGRIYEHAERDGQTIWRDPYPILITKPEDALDRARAIIESGKEDYDIVLFDLPGTINNPGVAKTVSLMDYIFCPVAADKLILESSLAFAMKVRDEIMTVSGCSVKDMYMLWNLVDAREKTDLYERYEEVFEEQMLQTLKTRLPDAKKYRREGSKDAARAVFRSTLLPPDKNLLKGSRLVELADEILGIIKL